MKQRGVTIIELMISIVIGLALVSVLLGVFSGSSGANRLSDAQAQMNEDAQYALQLLAKQIRLAGYSASPTTAVTDSIFGCDNGFTNATGASPAANRLALTCNPTSSAVGHGLAIAYFADSFNSTPHAVRNRPTDCTGNDILTATGTIENRFFIDVTNTLRCVGNGSGDGTAAYTTSVPLLENIERIDFFYGVANAANERNVGRYLTSTQIGAAANAANWDLIRTIRICLSLRSEKPVLESNSIHEHCNPVVGGNTAITTTDPTNPNNPIVRHLRRTYSMTVALRNGLPE